MRVGLHVQIPTTSLWNFAMSSGLREKFRHGMSIIVAYYHLISTNVDSQSDKLDRCWSTEMTVPATVDE